MNKPTLPPGEPQTAFASESRRKYINKTTGQPENHDRTWAGAIDLPGGGRAWAAIVADGCGGDSRGTQVAESCVAAFRAAVAGSSAAELSDLARARAWVARWGDALQATVVGGPLKGGNSTLAAAVAVRDPAAPGTLSLLLTNVGDSPMFLYSGPGLHALNVTPDEPEDNPNAGAGGNGLRRAIGLTAAGGFPLMDVAIRRLPPEGGPYGLAVCSDGVTDYSKVATQGGVRTIKKLKLLNASGFRRILASGMPFASRPAAILAESLAVARRRGVAETQMDNSSVALLGVGLENGVRLADAPSATSSSRSPRRRLLLVSIAAAALLVVAGVLAAVLRPKGKEPDAVDYVPRRSPSSSRIAPTNAAPAVVSSTNDVATNAVPAVTAITNAVPVASTNAPAKALGRAPVPIASTNAPAKASGRAPVPIASTNAPAKASGRAPVPIAATNAPAKAPGIAPVSFAATNAPARAAKDLKPQNAAVGFRPVPVDSAQGKPAKEEPESSVRSVPNDPTPDEAKPAEPAVDEWTEAKRTLDACLGEGRSSSPDGIGRCLREMKRQIEVHPDWTNHLDKYFKDHGKDALFPRIRFANRSKIPLVVRTGEKSQRVVFEGKEETVPFEIGFLKSGLACYCVEPAENVLTAEGRCKDCWKLDPESKVVLAWDSGEIEVPLTAPTPREKPVWTPDLPDSPWRLERKEGDRWISVDIPKDGRIELAPHSDAEFRFDLGDRTQVWIVHAGHCGEAVKAEGKKPAEKPKFPSVRIENRGPRAVLVIAPPETNKQVRLEPFVPKDFPVPQDCLSDEEAFEYKIIDRLPATTTSRSFRTVLLRGEDIKIENPFSPKPSVHLSEYLKDNSEEVISFFNKLKGHLDNGKKDEANVEDILNGSGDFEKLGERLLNHENAKDNIYGFIRWFYSVANEQYPAVEWPRLTDSDWKKCESIWNSWELYEVQENETIEGLAKSRLRPGARKSEIEKCEDAICTRNGIPDANKISVGQKILLPPKK